MQLKLRNELTADDLPYIESAFFAVGKVKSARHIPFGGIINLDALLRDSDWLYGSVSAHNHGGRNDRQWERLLERVEHYDLVLVGDRSNPPFSPAFRWNADADQPGGGTWAIQERILTHSLSWLLRSVSTSSRRIGAASVAAVVVSGMATTAARSPAPEQKRYPLLSKLTYDPMPSVSASKVVATRFKWQNEFNGPETRRSGEIKNTDPVYSELRRRELPEGDYRLEFQNAALDTLAIKRARR